MSEAINRQQPSSVTPFPAASPLHPSPAASDPPCCGVVLTSDLDMEKTEIERHIQSF